MDVIAMQERALIQLQREVAETRIERDVLQRNFNQVTSAIRPNESARNGFALRQIEREAILAALNESKWVQTKAATLLGVRIRTLQQKMLTHNIPRPRARAVGEQ